MNTVILKLSQDDNMGDNGFILKGMPSNEYGDFAAAFDGLVVAHDVMEHLNGPEKIGSVWDEFIALGAMWFIRGSSLGGPIYSPTDSLMEEIKRAACTYFAHGEPGWDFPVYSRRPSEKLRLKLPYDGGMFGEIEYLFRDSKELRDLFVKEVFENSGSDSRTRASAFNFWESYKIRIEAHVEWGFVRAFDKYKHPYEAHDQFKAISAAADKLIKNRGDYYEGAEFKLTYGEGKAYIDPAWEDEEEYE